MIKYDSVTKSLSSYVPFEAFSDNFICGVEVSKTKSFRGDLTFVNEKSVEGSVTTRPLV